MGREIGWGDHDYCALKTIVKDGKIERIFQPKYPYEYLRDAETLRKGDPERNIPSRRERVLAFFGATAAEKKE